MDSTHTKSDWVFLKIKDWNLFGIQLCFLFKFYASPEILTSIYNSVLFLDLDAQDASSLEQVKKFSKDKLDGF